MSDELAERSTQIAIMVAWLCFGALLGGGLALGLAPESSAALVAALLLFPLTLPLGWLLLLPLALLRLPFALPGMIRAMGQPLPPLSRPSQRESLPLGAVGWVFVLASVPTSLIAGWLAGAPITYLCCGLGYGYLLRRSRALQALQ